MEIALASAIKLGFGFAIGATLATPVMAIGIVIVFVLLSLFK